MQPRSARTYDEQRRVREEGDEQQNRSNGNARQAGPPQDPFVRIKIVGLEKNRRDIYIKFNAESNLPSYRNSTYRSISRSYSEFLKLSEALSITCPQSILPALPLAQTSAATDEEDDRLVKLAFQRWVGRVTSDQAVMKDEEMRSFIESDFGYTPRSRRKTGSSFHFPRGSRLPGEQDDDLTLAKSAMTRLELQFNETAKVVEKVSKARRQVAQAYNDVGDHLNTFATTETYTPLANGIKKLARTTKVQADLLAVQSTAEQVSLGDSLAYQAMNARSAKQTLSGRDSIVDEHREAVKSTISKRRAIEKMKSSASIKGDRVDEALDELDEAQKHETLLSHRLSAISTNLQPSLQTHSRAAHQDLLTTLLDHARSTLLYEKQLLKELELVRPELHNIKKPQAGVYYHTPPAGMGSPTPNPRGPPGPIGAGGGGSPTMQRTSSLGASSTSTISPNRDGVRPGSKSMFVGRGAPNFGEEGPLGGAGPLGAEGGGASMAKKVQQRTVRSMASSVQVEGDRRQRVDVSFCFDACPSRSG
ncbi:Vps5 C terminal like-domain-containing protein [Leucosporidium creatinivorum]|uniref:Vps5 C terminal like-domain-containing protein n=1 Tax=Leucosporidium creatinivorum TaxID=106004 RepID=A0A1Y2F9Z9_9BASI|nr:Vps5 C terminal like-domain-containing protein [Leucosporidium creatinivorum]